MLVNVKWLWFLCDRRFLGCEVLEIRKSFRFQKTSSQSVVTREPALRQRFNDLWSNLFRQYLESKCALLKSEFYSWPCFQEARYYSTAEKVWERNYNKVSFLSDASYGLVLLTGTSKHWLYNSLIYFVHCYYYLLGGGLCLFLVAAVSRPISCPPDQWFSTRSGARNMESGAHTNYGLLQNWTIKWWNGLYTYLPCKIRTEQFI
jgi:hypothetical protein